MALSLKPRRCRGNGMGETEVDAGGGGGVDPKSPIIGGGGGAYGEGA